MPGGSPRERALRRMRRRYGIRDDDPRRAEVEEALEGTLEFAGAQLGEAWKDLEDALKKAAEETLGPLWKLLRKSP